MRLNIPALNTKLQLVDSWSFELPNFYWNRLVWVQFFGPETWNLVANFPLTADKCRMVTIPVGTVLEITRIDFRAKDPYPVRFQITKKNNPNTSVYGRFWVTLESANLADVKQV